MGLPNSGGVYGFADPKTGSVYGFEVPNIGSTYGFGGPDGPDDGAVLARSFSALRLLPEMRLIFGGIAVTL